MVKRKKKTYTRKRERHLSIRSVRHDEPDLEKIARSVFSIAYALAAQDEQEKLTIAPVEPP